MRLRYFAASWRVSAGQRIVATDLVRYEGLSFRRGSHSVLLMIVLIACLKLLGGLTHRAVENVSVKIGS